MATPVALEFQILSGAQPGLKVGWTVGGVDVLAVGRGLSSTLNSGSGMELFWCILSGINRAFEPETIMSHHKL